jgi:hypothetical protein
MIADSASNGPQYNKSHRSSMTVRISLVYYSRLELALFIIVICFHLSNEKNFVSLIESMSASIKTIARFCSNGMTSARFDSSRPSR